MILIQIILVTGFILFLWRLLTNPNSYQVRAWTKIIAILFAFAAIVAIIFPETTNSLAKFLGVKRGADLLLYSLALVFIFFVLNVYIANKKLQNKIVLLSRKIAIIEANNNHKKS
jgi:hypothetical protein